MTRSFFTGRRAGPLARCEREMRRRARGIVKSDRMDKTISVLVERLVQHPRYEKYVRHRSTFKAHDSHNEAGVGDLVEIEETRPLSRTKCWRLVRILRRARGAEAEPALQEADAPQPEGEA